MPDCCCVRSVSKRQASLLYVLNKCVFFIDGHQSPQKRHKRSSSSWVVSDWLSFGRNYAESVIDRGLSFFSSWGRPTALSPNQPHPPRPPVGLGGIQSVLDFFCMVIPLLTLVLPANAQEADYARSVPSRRCHGCRGMRRYLLLRYLAVLDAVRKTSPSPLPKSCASSFSMLGRER